MLLFFSFFLNFFSIFLNFFSKPFILSNLVSSYTLFFLISGFLVSVFLIFISSSRLTNSIGLSLLSLLFFLVFLINYFNNIISFFFIYELFFLPSLLIIYYYSPNVRFLAALSYFTIWTQVGSLMLLSCVLYLYFYNFSINFFYSNLTLPYLPSILICLGLGVKIPIWPFHFWLTKTHVEAPTFFSIYLSGFLVKTAVLGFILVIPKIDPAVYYAGVVVLFVGILDSTLKFICQVDLKKLVAYTTIQEMNMILLFTFLDHKSSIIYIGSFILVHTILSSIFFYISDIIYRKFRSRSTNNICGLLNINLSFSLFIVLSVLLFSAFPYTFKFFVEMKFYTIVFNFNPYLAVTLIFFVNFLGNFFFFKIWLGVLYGNPGACLSFFLKKKDTLFFIHFFSLFIAFSFLVWYV